MFGIPSLVVGVLGGLAFPDERALPRSSPESQGVDSAALAQFVQEADQKVMSLHSLMVVRRGHVIAEGWWAPYDAGTRHSLYSLSKSFTSTAVGMAIEQGKLSLDDEVLKFFPDQAPQQPSANLKAMRVRDLLSMSTGHQSEPPGNGTDRVKDFLAHPVPFKPGTHFLYNTPATYICSAIVQKVTGQTVLDYLKPRLFQPLGIDQPTWGTCPKGITLGGYGLSVRTEDIAKFGLLYLQKGVCEGKTLVAPAWIDTATSRQTSNGSNPKSDWDQGYGYQFWRCRHGAYRGDGAFGQYCIVFPKEEMVIAITSGLGNMQQVLDLVWGTILPGVKKEPLPVNEAKHAALKQSLAGLRLPAVVGSAAPAADFSMDYSMEANPLQLKTVRLRKSEKGHELTARFGEAEHRFELRSGEWTQGTGNWGKDAGQPIATTGGWTDPQVFTLKICYRETPFIQTLRLRFGPEQLEIQGEANVGFGPTKIGPVKGKASPTR